MKKQKALSKQVRMGEVFQNRRKEKTQLRDKDESIKLENIGDQHERVS